MKRHRKLLLTTLLLVMSGLPVMAQGVKLTPSGGSFSIIFPGADKPSGKIETVNESGPAYPYTTHLFSQQDGDLLAMAGWIDYNPSFTFDPRGEMLATRDKFLKSVGGTLVSQTDLKLGVYDGLEFVIDMKGFRTIKGRIFIAGKQPTMAIAVVPVGKLTVEADAFLDSMKFTK